MSTNEANAPIYEDSLDDIEVKSNIVDKFKVEKDTKYRVGFPLLNANGKIVIRKVDSFNFEDKEGKFVNWVAPSDPDLFALCKKQGAELKTSYVTVLVVYRTNKQGQLLNPLSYELIPVVLGGKKVADLKEINVEWDLATIDVSITTDNPKFQHHTYTPLKSAIWRLKEGDPTLQKLGLSHSIEAEVIAKARDLANDMTKAIANEKSEAQIKEILGISDTADAPQEAVANFDEEFADIGDLG